MARPGALTVLLGAAVAVPAVATPAAAVVGVDPAVLAQLSTWSLSAVLMAVAWGITRTRHLDTVVSALTERIVSLETARTETHDLISSIDDKLNILINREIGPGQPDARDKDKEKRA